MTGGVAVRAAEAPLALLGGVFDIRAGADEGPGTEVVLGTVAEAPTTLADPATGSPVVADVVDAQAPSDTTIAAATSGKAFIRLRRPLNVIGSATAR